MADGDKTKAQLVLSDFKGRRHQHERCIEEALDVAERLCRHRGSRLTALRRRVLELVWQSHAPVKAYDVLEALRAERAGAAPPTVYRALDFLRDEGLIHRLESLNAYVGCPAPGEGHSSQFLICRECRGVAELDDDDVLVGLRRDAEALGFRMLSTTIEVEGLCRHCHDTNSGR